MPLLGQQEDVVVALKDIGSILHQPKAIVLISAHWISTTEGFIVSTAAQPPMIYDYGGFPKEAYQLKYEAPGSPELAEKIFTLLTDKGVPATKDAIRFCIDHAILLHFLANSKYLPIQHRGFDHGAFVPLMLMYPDATIPVVSLSIHHSFDPAYHILAGEALSSLREEGVLFIGSGSSFHNFNYFFTKSPSERAEGVQQSLLWNDYLVETLTSEEVRGAVQRYSTEGF